MATMNHTTDTDPVSATLRCIDDLLARSIAQAEMAGELRVKLGDVMEERRVREAQVLLLTEGKNEAERQARARLALACDADYSGVRSPNAPSVATCRGWRHSSG